tara:strand:- start:249 stop:509 length:261 start_codon:yes stop_codon:yes gene_type:complete
MFDEERVQLFVDVYEIGKAYIKNIEVPTFVEEMARAFENNDMNLEDSYHELKEFDSVLYAILHEMYGEEDTVEDDEDPLQIGNGEY